MTAPSSPDRLASLTALLRYFSWSPRGGAPGQYVVWVPPEDEREDGELLVPLDPESGDFTALLDRAQRNLLTHYGATARNVLEMYQVRAAARLDATLWKKQTALDAGLISWEQGETLYAAARAQLVAAAKSSREKRRYHGNASAHVAKRFIENTLMGQTAIGSYVISAYTPSAHRFHLSRSAEDYFNASGQTSVVDAGTLSGREILQTFEMALQAVRQGLDEYKKSPRIELFLESVSEGVSYEFARALSEIVSGGDSAIEIRRQTSDSTNVDATEIAFDAVEAPILSSVANAFAQDPEPLEVTLLGEVTLLSRSTALPDRLIRLKVQDGADINVVRVLLSTQQYELALNAHRQEASLQVSGRLEREGNLYWLYNPNNVTVVAAPRASSQPTGERGQPYDVGLFDDDV